MKTRILLIVLFFINLTGLKAQWSEVNSNTTNIVSEISFADPSNGFAVGGYGTIIKTKDSGKTWEAITTGFTAISSLFGIDKDTVYVSKNGVYKSLNSCQTWNEVGGMEDGPGITSILFTTSQVGFIIKGGTLYKTKNYGLSWYKVLDNANSGIINFPTESTGYIAGGSITRCEIPPCPVRGYIYKTTDAGETWQRLNFFGDTLLVKAATFLPNSIGYCFTATDVYSVCKTTDGGETWKNSIVNFYIQDGLFINESVGYILSSNGKIYVTKDGGIDWQLEYTSDKELLYLGASDKVVMAGGRNGALLRRELGDLIQTSNKDIVSNFKNSVFYPNPSTGILIFSPSKEIESISIRNLAGQTVYQGGMLQDNKLDIGYLPGGIYLVEVGLANNERVVEKLVVSSVKQ